MIEKALGHRAAAGVDMLVMPELFLPGYNSAFQPRDDWPEILATLRATIARHGVALTIGLPEWQGDRCYDAAFAIADNGAKRARYRKVQLFGSRETALFTPGDRHWMFT